MPPIDFLLYSPTYQQKVNVPARKRRELAMRFMKDDYHFARGSALAAIEEARSKGLPASPSSLNADRILYCELDQYLKGDEHARNKVLEHARAFPMWYPYEAVRRAIEWLAQDGIHSWDDVQDRKTKAESIAPEDVLVLTEAAAAEPEPETIFIAFPIAEYTKERDAFVAHMARASAFLSELTDRIGAQAEESRGLRRRIYELERQARKIRIAPSLAEEGIDPGPLEGAVRLAERAEKIARLPQRSTFYRGNTMAYSDPFVREFLILSDPDKNQVVDHLALLADYGKDYQSLETKRPEIKLPHTPPKSWYSRASDRLRFTWKLLRDEIIVYALIPRGDIYKK